MNRHDAVAHGGVACVLTPGAGLAGTVTRLVSSASSEQSDNSWVGADLSTPMEQECGQVLGSIRLSPRKQREAAPKWQPQAARAAARLARR